jgi:hypothetical protein
MNEIMCENAMLANLRGIRLLVSLTVKMGIFLACSKRAALGMAMKTL